MLNILLIVITAIFNILPDDPFKTIVDGVIYDLDFLPTLNWFLPFDVCANLTLAWLDCLLAYYLFVLIKKLVVDIIIPRVFSSLSVGIAGLSGLV
jgi:hypothetical protein